jgi:thymidylate kinase
MIILEGIDAAGKTTIANALAARLRTNVIHSSKPKLDMGWVEYHSRSLNMPAVILDRYHIGEAIWPIIFEDGRKPMLRWQQHMVERILLQRGAILVQVIDSFDIINERLKQRQEDEISRQYYNQVIDLFRDACEHSLLDYIYVHNGMRDIHETLDLICSLYARTQYQRAHIARFRGTGSVKPGGIMVVGERNISGLNILDDTYAPLCNLTDRNLHIALQLSGRTDFYLTYFKKTGNRRNDRHALINEQGLLQPSRIVCVDPLAYYECSSLFPGAKVILTEKKSNAQDYAKFFI